MRPEAIYATHPNVVRIDDSSGAFDINEKLIQLDESLVQEKIAELEAAEPMRLLRIERNRRLAETDWITLKAYSQKQDVSENWANYMQALRDLPATANPKLDEQGNLTNINWPEVPE